MSIYLFLNFYVFKYILLVTDNLDKREDIACKFFELLTTVKVFEFDEEGVACDGSAEFFDEVAGCAGSTAGCKHIIEDEHVSTFVDCITMNPEGVFAIFKLEFLL